MNMHRVIEVLERVFLAVIALMTIAAMGQEVWRIIGDRQVELKDLLLMFIYAEVLGMIGAYYTNNRIPISLPLFIAITALSRMIVLQGKDLDPSILLYESGSILALAVACWVIRARTPRQVLEDKRTAE
ncbi:MAG: phosphate-starvation-inducible PsiE family protein [Rhodospirillaceae bacterium]|nr:phosphate-starvation-inducible PsiE family protein [Rhodospirillaceae bacterium]